MKYTEVQSKYRDTQAVLATLVSGWSLSPDANTLETVMETWRVTGGKTHLNARDPESVRTIVISRWHYVNMILWDHGNLTLLSYDTLSLWHMFIRHCDTMKPWYCDTMIPILYCDTGINWLWDIMIPWYCNTKIL